MDKIYIDDTHLWYNQGVHRAICSLAKKHNNAIPVFGGALGAYNHINCESPDLDEFVKYLPEVIESAKFYKWHEGTVGALRRFCRLCLVDPALIEAHLGTTFEELCR